MYKGEKAMCIFRRLFKKNQQEETATPEPWFNDSGNLERGSFFKTTKDPYTGKKKKPLMDPVYNHIPGNGQDSNSIHKSGV